MATSREGSLARGLVRSATSVSRGCGGTSAKGQLRLCNFDSMGCGRRARPGDCVCRAKAPTLSFPISDRPQIAWSRAINFSYQRFRGANAEALLQSKHFCSSAIRRRRASGNHAAQAVAADRRFRACARKQIMSGREYCCKTRLRCDRFYQAGGANRATSVDCRCQAFAATQRVRAHGTRHIVPGSAQKFAIHTRSKALCRTQDGRGTVGENHASKTAAPTAGLWIEARRQVGSRPSAKGKSRHRCYRSYRTGAAGSTVSASCVVQTSLVQTIRVSRGKQFRSDHVAIRGHVDSFKITPAQVAVGADADVLGHFATVARLPLALAATRRTPNWHVDWLQAIGSVPWRSSPRAADATCFLGRSRRLLIDARTGTRAGKSSVLTDASAAHSKCGIFVRTVCFTTPPANAWPLLRSVPSMDRGQANIPRGHNRAIDLGPAISQRHLAWLVHRVRHEWPGQDSAGTNDLRRPRSESRFALSGWVHIADLKNSTKRQTALPRGAMRRKQAAPPAEAGPDTTERFASERRLRRATDLTFADPASIAQLSPPLRLRPIAEATAALARANSRLGSCVRALGIQAHRENTIRDTRPATVYCSWPLPPLMIGLIAKGVRIRQTNGDEAMARMLCPPEAGVAREKAFAMFTEQADRADVRQLVNSRTQQHLASSNSREMDAIRCATKSQFENFGDGRHSAGEQH